MPQGAPRYLQPLQTRDNTFIFTPSDLVSYLGFITIPASLARVKSKETAKHFLKN